MRKQSLQFLALPELSLFCSHLTNGYIINTINLTVTALMSDVQVQLAKGFFYAEVVELVKDEYSTEDLFA